VHEVLRTRPVIDGSARQVVAPSISLGQWTIPPATTSLSTSARQVPMKRCTAMPPSTPTPGEHGDRLCHPPMAVRDLFSTPFVISDLPIRAAAYITNVSDDSCVCGHARAAHEHYRSGGDCGSCPSGQCRRYRRDNILRRICRRVVRALRLRRGCNLLRSATPRGGYALPGDEAASAQAS
jgi:hypothetical protein